MTEKADDSPLKGKTPTEKASLIKLLIERADPLIRLQLEEYRGRWLRLLEYHQASVDLLRPNVSQVRARVIARYHEASSMMRAGDLRASGPDIELINRYKAECAKRERGRKKA